MNQFYIQSIGVYGPGITDWEQLQSILVNGLEIDLGSSPAKPVISILPPNERRRTTKTIKIAINCIEQLRKQATEEQMSLASVFSSSCGDVDLVQSICIALSQPGKPVSPTQFHNSVHNAAAGYWSIGNQCVQATTSISAAAGSLAAGLLESFCQMQEHSEGVILCCYDIASPSPMNQIRDIHSDFGCAFLLTPEPTAETTAQITIEADNPSNQSEMTQKDFEKLRVNNPAAASLPLLEKLALKEDAEIIIPYMPEAGMRLTINCNQSW